MQSNSPPVEYPNKSLAIAEFNKFRDAVMLRYTLPTNLQIADTSFTPASYFSFLAKSFKKIKSQAKHGFLSFPIAWHQKSGALLNFCIYEPTDDTCQKILAEHKKNNTKPAPDIKKTIKQGNFAVRQLVMAYIADTVVDDVVSPDFIQKDDVNNSIQVIALDDTFVVGLYWSELELNANIDFSDMDLLVQQTILTEANIKKAIEAEKALSVLATAP